MRRVNSLMILLLLTSSSGCGLMNPKADVVMHEPGPPVKVGVPTPCVEEVKKPDHWADEEITPKTKLLPKVKLLLTSLVQHRYYEAQLEANQHRRVYS